MSRPYHTSFDETKSPMTSPSPSFGTPSAPLLAPFKTNLGRAKSKRWAEAKTVDYGGEGWGGDDDFDEDDPYGDDGYGPEAPNQGSGQQSSSYGSGDDVPPKPVEKLSALGRPSSGSAVPRVETLSPDLGVPLPPTPLEMEQQEQASRKNTFPFYNNSGSPKQSQSGGILQSFLPQIITSRSSSPARGILRAQTMGVDKLPPMVSPISPPPPPPSAKDKFVPPVGYYSSSSTSRTSSPRRGSTPQPFRSYSSMGPGTDHAQHISVSTVNYGLDRPTPLPKGTTVGDKPLPPWQSPSTQSGSPSPTSPPPHFTINEQGHSEIEQSQLRHGLPASGERYSPPPPPQAPPKIKRVETAPLMTSWGSTSQRSVNQSQNSIPRRPTGRSSSHGNGQGMKFSRNEEMHDGCKGNRSSQDSQLRCSPEQRRDQPGSPRSSQGRQSPEDRHDQPGSLRSSQSPEEILNQPESNKNFQIHHPPPHEAYQGNEYVDEEYYASPTTQQPQVQQPPQQSHQSSFSPQYQPMMSPQPVVPITQHNSFPTQSSPSPSLLSGVDPERRTIHPSDVYARNGEEREEEYRESDTESRVRAARGSIDSTTGGGVSIGHSAGPSTDPQPGHLSPDPLPSRNRSRGRIPEPRERNSSRPSSRQDMGPAARRGSHSGSRPHSSHAKGSRPGSRQDIVRSPSPFPPPTTSLPPIPPTTDPASPASPVHEAAADEKFAEHKKRQQEGVRYSSWNDIISDYGDSEDVEVQYQRQQQQLPLDPSSFDVVHKPQSQQQPQSLDRLEWDSYPPNMSPQPQFENHSSLERSPSGVFKSMVHNAFKRQDTHRPTPATPISPITSDDGLAIPRGSSIDDAISPILPSAGPFAPINRSGTAPLPQVSVSLPPHQLERSQTERPVGHENNIAKSRYRKSVCAGGNVPTIVPLLDMQGSRGEVSEVTPDTPVVKLKDGPSMLVSSQEEDAYDNMGMERKDDAESRESQEGSERGNDGDRSPEKDYLDTFLVELERAQTPKQVNTLPGEQRPHGPSISGVEPVPQPKLQGQIQGQHEGWQHQQLYGLEESQHGQEQRDQYEREQHHFDPSSYEIVHAHQHQYQEKEFPQQPQYEQHQYEEQQQSQYEQHQPQYGAQQRGHLPPSQYSDTDQKRESIGVFGYYDSYWTAEDTSPPPPPPIKSPKRPSAPDLKLLSSMSAASHRDSQSEIPLLPPPQGGSTMVKIIPTPVSISDRSVPIERPEQTPASALEAPDKEFLEMNITRKQFLARTQIDALVADEREKGEGEVIEENEGEGGVGEGKQEIEKQEANETDDEEAGILTVEGHEVVEYRSAGGSQPADEDVLEGGTSKIRAQSPTGGAEVIPQTRILGPESEGIEAIAGPTKVIREESPKKESKDDGETTPMQSDYARELLNQFSRPQTLMLKDTMPMPSGLLVMPPMPPKEEGEEEVPDVVDFSMKDNDTDDEVSKAHKDELTVKGPGNSHSEGSVDVGKPRQYMDPRDAARLPNPEDRVAAYNQARQVISEAPTGLGDWIKYMMEENEGEQLLKLTIEAHLRPETSNERHQQPVIPMAKQPSAESDHRTLHSVPSVRGSPVLPGGVMKPGQANMNSGNGGVEITPTPSAMTGGSAGSNLVRDNSHSPSVDKAVDRAKGFLSRFGGKKGKESKELKEFQHDGASTLVMQQSQGQTAGSEGYQQRERMLSQVQDIPQNPPQSRQPPMTSGHPPDQPLLDMPRSQSQPWPPHLIIPGAGDTQRSVSNSFLQQTAVDPVGTPHKPASSTGPQNKYQPPQPPQPPPEAIRLSTHSHIIGERKPERSSQTPPPTISTISQSPAQQTQKTPKGSDTLYSQKWFQDSPRSSSPVTQRPDRSGSHSSSTEGINRRSMRSDSLSQQQKLQHIPKGSDSTTSIPSSTISDNVISSISAHPHKAQGAFQSIPQRLSPPPPVGDRYAGEKRGQNTFAHREGEPEGPETPKSPQKLQQAPAPIVRPNGPHSDPGPGVQRTQTYLGSHPKPYIGNEQGFVQNRTAEAPPPISSQDSSMTYDDEELYSLPPPKIQTQKPSPPRGPPLGGPQQYQQGYQNGPPPKMGHGGSSQGLVQGIQEPQFSSVGQPGQGPPQIASPGSQLGLQGQRIGPMGQHYQLGDPRGQYKNGPQFHHGPPFHPGQPISTGLQSEPGVRRTSSGLVVLGGVTSKRYSTDSTQQSPNSADSVQYAGSTTSSQEKRHSSFFGNLKSKMDDSMRSPQKTQMETPQSVSPQGPRVESARRTSFMKGRKKEKSDGPISSKEKKEERKERKEKPEKNHKKGFSMNMFSRTESILGKLTKPAPPSQASVHQPPLSKQQQQQFQPRQMQPQSQPITQNFPQQQIVQKSYNPWTGKHEPTEQQLGLNQGAYVENVNAQSPPLGRGNPLVGSSATPRTPPQQPLPQQQPPARQPSVSQYSPPPQQVGQPQYEQVPIPQGYGHLQGEYHIRQGQFAQQPPQQIQGYRQGFTNVDRRADSPSVNRNPSQVSSHVSEIRPSIDHHNISPDLSRTGTQVSRTHEATRSLSPTSEVGSHFGRQQSLREGSIPETPPAQLSPRSSLREGQVHEKQRYQQPLPLPQSIAQVQNGAGVYGGSPSTISLPVSSPPMNISYGPSVQARPVTPLSVLEETKLQAVSSTPPPPPPKQPLAESKQGEAETKTFYDSGSSRLSNDGLSLKVSSPVLPASSAPAPPLDGKIPTLSPPSKEEVAKEEHDFSTEKIAVNLDLHGEMSKTKKDGDESDDEYTMSATAYPGQAWDPSHYGWNL